MQKDTKRFVAVGLLIVGAIGLVALAGAAPQADPAPPILGKWAWYRGTMQVFADGTCHWQGADHEEHGKWKKSSGYFFDWGEKDNDWNYLNVDEQGRLSGRAIQWGGSLEGNRPQE